MKCRELMIGDWVHVKLIRTPIQVEGNFNGKVTLIDDLNSQIGVGNKLAFDCDEIEPIPLTPEILEKNGFVQEKASYALILHVLYVGHPIYVKASKTVFIEFHENYIGINICHVAGKMRKMDGSIKYVHELQHALKLCGIEKEIEL